MEKFGRHQTWYQPQKGPAVVHLPTTDSMLSVVSEVLKKIIYSRVAENLESVCPPPSNQWRLLPHRSTTSAFIKLRRLADTAPRRK